jgi:hypothetical protein
MEALTCKLCGGKLLINGEGTYATCQYCKVEYSFESLKSMIKALKDTELTVTVKENVDDLIQQALNCCRIDDFAKARNLIDQALHVEPENPQVHLAHLIVHCRCTSEDDLKSYGTTLTAQSGFNAIMKFGDEEFKERVRDIERIRSVNITKKKEEEGRKNAIIKDLWERLNAEKQAQCKARIEILTYNTPGSLITPLNQQLYDLNVRISGCRDRDRQEFQRLEAQRSSVSKELWSLKQECAWLKDELKKTWEVVYLDEEKAGALMLLNWTLDLGPYHPVSESVFWASSGLRKWLNGGYFNSLPDEIKGRIELTTIDNPQNPDFGTPGGPSTQDRVFVLSYEEYQLLSKRPTLPRRIKKTNDPDSGDYAYWWLRTPGVDQGKAMYVDDDGKMVTGGMDTSATQLVIRPAFWMKI